MITIQCALMIKHRVSYLISFQSLITVVAFFVMFQELLMTFVELCFGCGLRRPSIAIHCFFNSSVLCIFQSPTVCSQCSRCWATVVNKTRVPLYGIFRLVR